VFLAAFCIPHEPNNLPGFAVTRTEYAPKRAKLELSSSCLVMKNLLRGPSPPPNMVPVKTGRRNPWVEAKANVTSIRMG